MFDSRWSDNSSSLNLQITISKKQIICLQRQSRSFDFFSAEHACSLPQRADLWIRVASHPLWWSTRQWLSSFLEESWGQQASKTSSHNNLKLFCSSSSLSSLIRKETSNLFVLLKVIFCAWYKRCYRVNLLLLFFNFSLISYILYQSPTFFSDFHACSVFSESLSEDFLPPSLALFLSKGS